MMFYIDLLDFTPIQNVSLKPHTHNIDAYNLYFKKIS
jgi:hypothetical protein